MALAEAAHLILRLVFERRDHSELTKDTLGNGIFDEVLK